MVMAAASPVLREALTHSENLAALAEIGEQALTQITAAKPLPQNKFASISQTIAAAKKPHGETELMIVSGIDQLVKAAFK